MKPLLLLVDDDAAFAAVFARALERRGIESMHAADADAARTLIGQLRFTHAVIDLNLGGGDSGLVVLRHLRTQQPACRAVILTGFASIATAVEATRSGAVHYLPKPATIDEVLAALSDRPAAGDPPIPDKPLHPRRLEWEYIQRVLLEHDGNISATARALGMHRRTLQRKLAKYPPPPRP
ncbi:MAG: response regulator [Zetaproteobacteria bacterium]|nr:MAG: response regulator [Zetaproteobacteria bacterium]